MFMGKLVHLHFGHQLAALNESIREPESSAAPESDRPRYAGSTAVKLCLAPEGAMVDIAAIIESGQGDENGSEDQRLAAKEKREQEIEGLVALAQVLGLPLESRADESKIDFEARKAAQKATQKQVFGDIVLLTSGPVYGFALRLCGYEQEVAEELVQITYLRAWRSFHTFRGDASFKSWLQKITLNVARNTEPKRRERQNKVVHWIAHSETEDVFHEKNEGDTTPNIHDDTTDELYRQVETIHILRPPIHEALMALTQQQRTVVVLHAIERYSHVEIAAMFGSNENAIKQRYHNALKKLRVSLEATHTTWNLPQ